jgi:GWxTD domain-containing protein
MKTPTASVLIAQAPAPQPQPPRVQAAASSPYQKWVTEDVVYIITAEERDAFGRLVNDDERQRFVEQFWLRRDPTPGTDENEFKEEHYRRIAWADDRYFTSDPGWTTDRGRIYITYGPPDDVDDHSGAAGTSPYQIWHYRHLDGIGDDVVLEFVDSAHTGDYRQTFDPRGPGPQR